MPFIYDMTDTWNDAARTFDGIKMNVTDTASADGSMLFDLQVDGSRKFRIFKDGGIEALTLAAVSAILTGYTPVKTLVGRMADWSDGGVNMRMIQPSTSWYNETLTTGPWLGDAADETAARNISGAGTGAYYHNTTDGLFYSLDATSGQTEVFRGQKAGFPEEHVLIAEAGRVIVFDATDPTLPMWRVEDYTGLTLTKCDLLDGQLVIGAITGVIVSDYIGDDLGSTTLDYTTSTSPAIVSNVVNDVAIAALPDAPIDPSTGMPVPTIAVFTNGGVSQIGWDGVGTNNIWDELSGLKWQSGGFSKDGKIYGFLQATKDFWVFDTLTADTVLSHGTNGTNYNEGAVPSLFKTNDFGSNDDLMPKANVDGSFAYAKIETADAGIGLGFLKPNPGTPASGMVAYMTTTYNTGWMPGDIKGAWLADTTAETVTGAELVTNGDFATDVSGWTLSASTPPTWNASGYMQFNSDGVTLSDADQSLTTTLGKTYTIAFDAVALGGATLTLNIGTTQGASDLGTLSTASDGQHQLSFVATSSIAWIRFRDGTSAASQTIDNVTCRLADPDRSVKGNGLQVFGSVTKAAISSSDGIVLYSGGTDSDYLHQPYNADLDYGTAAWEFHTILRQNANSVLETLIERQSATAAAGWKLDVTSAGYLQLTVTDGTTTRTATGTTAIDDGLVRHVRFGYDGAGGIYIYVDDALYASASGAALLTLNNSNAVLSVLRAVATGSPSVNGALALVRASATAASSNQATFIFESEKPVRAGDPCTLYGGSDAVTDMAYDEVLGALHVGTSGGRSTFNGLRRVSNSATAVTKLAANNGLLVEM